MEKRGVEWRIVSEWREEAKMWERMRRRVCRAMNRSKKNSSGERCVAKNESNRA